MKKLTLISLLMLCMIGCNKKVEIANNTSSTAVQQRSNLTPLEVVNKRMVFFNEHNYEQFIKLYHKDVEVYTYPDRLMGTGSDRLSAIYKSDFAKRLVTVTVVNQMNNGSHVINHELVTNAGKETKYVAIYKVENGLITQVRFVR